MPMRLRSTKPASTTASSVKLWVTQGYALIEPDTCELELRRVEYDTAATIAKLRETYGAREWAPTILRRLETQQP